MFQQVTLNDVLLMSDVCVVVRRADRILKKTTDWFLVWF
jgi:hypothetical protein